MVVETVEPEEEVAVALVMHSGSLNSVFGLSLLGKSLEGCAAGVIVVARGGCWVEDQRVRRSAVDPALDRVWQRLCGCSPAFFVSQQVGVVHSSVC